MNDPYKIYKTLDFNPPIYMREIFLLPPKPLIKFGIKDWLLIKKALSLYGNFLKLLENHFNDTLKAFVHFKNNQKTVWSKSF